jgi:hypothetical protein
MCMMSGVALNWKPEQSGGVGLWGVQKLLMKKKTMEEGHRDRKRISCLSSSIFIQRGINESRISSEMVAIRIS